MKKISAKSGVRSRHAGRSKAKGGRTLEHDRGWNELEVQADRLKSDWMSLAVQLGIGGGQEKSVFE
ncbi:MAG: hypothetical protein KGL74_09990 [Elusimicrobia bacterium]|nr:hypothetical protein [Elusimicrobiota bacterium]MDE2511442.1 hypothetical protein [Elusimicrobiota bacterium]